MHIRWFLQNIVAVASTVCFFVVITIGCWSTFACASLLLPYEEKLEYFFWCYI